MSVILLSSRRMSRSAAGHTTETGTDSGIRTPVLKVQWL
jgi:hypothetical protein